MTATPATPVQNGSAAPSAAQDIQDIRPTPWYRQFWPWFLIALPASAVTASIATAWLAFTTPEVIVKTPTQAQTAYRPYREVRSAFPAAGRAAEVGEVADATAAAVRRGSEAAKTPSNPAPDDGAAPPAAAAAPSP